MLLDPRNGPAFDLAGPRAPFDRAIRRAVVVLSTPRTGSTLLCRTLWDSGRLAAPKEYFNPMQARDWAVRRGEHVASYLPSRALPLWERRWTPARRREHIATVLAHRTDASGLFACKLQHNQLGRWFGDLPGLEDAVGQLIIVRLTRDDKTAQARSWVRALQTGQWAAHQPVRGPTRVHPFALRRAARVLREREAAWDALLAGRQVLHLRSEDVFDDLDRSMRQVLDYAEVPSSGPLPPPALSAQRVAD